MKECLPIFIISLFLNTCISAQICNYGTTIKGTVEADHLTKLTVKAQINEYAWTDTSYRDFPTVSEFNTIHFLGEEGSSYIDFGIRNSILQFETDSVELDTIHYLLVTDYSRYEPGIGFYFWAYHNSALLTGVDLLSSEARFPRFAKHNESGGFYRDGRRVSLRLGMYSRDVLTLDQLEAPLTVTWTIEQKGSIVDPEIETLDYAIKQGFIQGQYAIWNIQMQINDTIVLVADYYLPYEIASQLNPKNPINLGQHYQTSRFHNPVNFIKNIEYTELSVTNEFGESFCIDEFEIIKSYVDIFCILEQPSFGWTIQDQHLTSIAEDDDAEFIFNSIGHQFDNSSIQYCALENQTTSVKSLDNFEPRIYPNPVDNILHIDVADSRTYSVIIRNISGHTILESDSLNPIDMTALDSGIYFLHISDKGSDRNSLHKIVKQ